MQLVSIYCRHFKLQRSSSVLPVLVVRCTVMHSDPTVHGDILFSRIKRSQSSIQTVIF